ncbi:MAG TPA: FtsX-like permease family protein [Acidimicrobiia bacterium]|nr:FtsX-like permease family protein [Acidimicrobiia bacterium]
MSAFAYRLRLEVRRGVRSLLVIGLLVGVAGGVVLASVGIARRTDTAFARMRGATDAWDVLVNPNNGNESKLRLDALRHLPGVARVGRIDGLVIYPSFVPSASDAFNLAPMLVTDREATYHVARPVITSGRLPSADDPRGVLAGRTFARQMHLRVGDTFQYVIMTPELLQRMQTAGSLANAQAILRDAPAELRGSARIDGIGVSQDGVVVNSGYVPTGLVFTPAFAAAHPGLEHPYWGAVVKLDPGTGVAAFTRRVQALVPHESIAFERASAIAQEVSDATDPDVLALSLFAGIVALLGLILVSQAVSRRMQIDAAANETWAAIGSTRAQRMSVAWTKVAFAIVLGAVAAVVIAIAASPLGPVGLVRVVESQPQVTADWPLLGVGFLAIVGVGLLIAAIPAWRWSKVVRDEPVPRRARVASAAGVMGGSVAAETGLRFALERQPGRAGVPVRATLLAGVTAVALVTMVAVFSGSLDHLVTTPRLFGSAWDAQVEVDNLNLPNGFGDGSGGGIAQLESQFMRVADRSGAVAASAVVPIGEVRSGSVAIPAIGFAHRLGDIAPTIAEGRAPRSPREVALGSTTMARLHTAVGRRIQLARNDHGTPVTVHVVGRAVLPGLAPYPGSDKAGLGTGALLTTAGWRTFSADFEKTEYVFRWADGGSVRSLSRVFGREMPSQLPLTVNDVNRPPGVISAERLRSTPALLALLVVLLLLVTVVNALVATVRRRSRDLALLRTLGMTTGQIVRTVLWQASAIAAVAIVVGVPVGLLIGRVGWDVLAEWLGTIAAPSVSVPLLVGIGAVVFAIVNVAGMVPGVRAARRSPAAALRAE